MIDTVESPQFIDRIARYASELVTIYIIGSLLLEQETQLKSNVVAGMLALTLSGIDRYHNRQGTS